MGSDEVIYDYEGFKKVLVNELKNPKNLRLYGLNPILGMIKDTKNNVLMSVFKASNGDIESSALFFRSIGLLVSSHTLDIKELNTRKLFMRSLVKKITDLKNTLENPICPFIENKELLLSELDKTTNEIEILYKPSRSLILEEFPKKTINPRKSKLLQGVLELTMLAFGSCRPTVGLNISNADYIVDKFGTDYNDLDWFKKVSAKVNKTK